MENTVAITNLNKFEKLKAEKDGLTLKEEIEKLAQLGWEAINGGDNASADITTRQNIQLRGIKYASTF